jgi:hypothetical protein
MCFHAVFQFHNQTLYKVDFVLVSAIARIFQAIRQFFDQISVFLFVKRQMGVDQFIENGEIESPFPVHGRPLQGSDEFPQKQAFPQGDVHAFDLLARVLYTINPIILIGIREAFWSVSGQYGMHDFPLASPATKRKQSKTAWNHQAQHADKGRFTNREWPAIPFPRFPNRSSVDLIAR